MSAAKPIQSLLPGSKFICFVIPGLFSEEECAQLLTPEVKNAFKKAISNYPAYYRNNDRQVVDNQELADFLFERVKPYLPAKLEVIGVNPSENGSWKLRELNNRLRYCRYAARQYFHRHLDGVHFRNPGTQSKLTFMVYLNDSSDFEGGRTLFYKDKFTSELWASYVPRKGDLIVFDHNIWHEGEILQAGEKFVLRSDILYDRISTPGIPQPVAPYTGHLGYIWKMILFDETTLLSSGRDKEIKAWNTEGVLQQSLKGHENSILCLEEMNDRTFLSGSRDRRIHVWEKNNQTFSLKQKIEIHEAVVLSLCRLDDDTFASAGGDNTVKVCSLHGTVLKTFSNHADWVWQVIRLDENFIASCSSDKSIRIWKWTGDEREHMFGGTHETFCLAYREHLNLLASGDLSGTITIRKLGDAPGFEQKEKFTIPAHSGIIRTLLFIDDNHLASGGEDNTVRIWSISTKQCVAKFEHLNFVQSILLKGNSSLLSASYDGTIKTWDISPYLNSNTAER